MILVSLCLALLTLFTYWDLQKETKKLEFQKANLEELRQLLQDKKLGELLAQKRQMGQEIESLKGRVQHLIHQIVGREGRLNNLVFHRLESERPGLEKRAYQVQLTHLTIRGLVNCLYYLELLPGAKVESLYLAKTKRSYRPWDASFRLVVYLPKKEKRR